MSDRHIQDAIPVMVVEDEPGLRHAYKIVLEAHGYDVATASNGEQALEALHKHKPRLILLDMLMPKMDGLAFIHAANLKEDYPDIKVIAFSNLSHNARLEEMRALGVHEHVLKADINPRELADLVAKALKG